MRIGIRAHDVFLRNEDGSPKKLSLEDLMPRIEEQGFCCTHIALGKSIEGFKPEPQNLTPGLALYLKRLCEEHHLDVAVLGNYQNLCHPDPETYQKILKRYIAHLRFASLLGCAVVGTETGAVNAEYKFEEANHSEEALQLFIERLTPVVRAAENFGVIMAIEPVWKHIVYNPQRARRVLDAIQSPNLQIILDPVNLLDYSNYEQQDEIIDEAFDLLKEDIAIVHLKDFQVQEETKSLVSVAAGTGGLHYERLVSLIKQHKPYVHCTLENTVPENAVSTREFLEKLYRNA